MAVGPSGLADTIARGPSSSRRWIPPARIRACALAANSGSSRQSATTQNIHYGAARVHHPDNATAAPNGGSARAYVAGLSRRRRSYQARRPPQGGGRCLHTYPGHADL